MADEINPPEPFPDSDDHDELNTQGDYVSGAIGSDNKDIIVGKNITAERTEQQNRQNVVFNNSDNNVIWHELLKITSTVSDLVAKLDSLPDRVGKLEVILKPASAFEKMFYFLIVAVVVLVGFVIYIQWK